MDFMIYPTFEIVEGRGVIPRIYLPRDFKKLVPIFYEQGRKQEVIDYVHGLARMIEDENFKNIRLNWDDVLGLRNISISSSCGLDLDVSGWPNFQEHNLGGSGRASFIGGAIAMKYISELLKSRPNAPE
ncbi:MAG: hypothetical protein AABX54_02515 [Nanoarchaeota archaeon]